MLITEIIGSYTTSLTEAEIPSTNYGYWVTNDGEVFAVGYMKHEEMIVDLGFKSGYDAMRQGWVRVISQPRRRVLNVEIEAFCPSARAVSVLRKMANPHEYDEFVLDVVDETNKRFSRPGPMLNLLQQYVRRMS